MVFFLKTLISLTLGLFALSVSADGVDIQILDPWVQAAPPNVKVLAAYLEIKNNGDKPQILINVASPAFGLVEVHQSVMHGNMAHMEHQKELTIPPHASVVLKQGGMHFMLTDAKKPLNANDSVPMTLTFKNGGKVTVTATVRSGQKEDMGDHQHMNHSEHEKHNH